jgi:starch synthase
LLVPYDEHDPDAFQQGLAESVNELLADPQRVAAMGQAGRARAITEFSWAAVAERTLQLYHQLLAVPAL